MNRTASALLRWVGVFGLYALIAVLIVPAMLMRWLGGGLIELIAELKDKADSLREGL